jgi:flagellar biogenesis protein FliO
MSLSLLMIMGFFLGVSWLLRITISEIFSARVRQRTEGSGCENC